MTPHPLLRLSAAGVRHAVRARHLPPAELARRVYTYHTLPITTPVADRLRAWPEIATWLDVGQNGWSRRLRDAFDASTDPDGHWMHWRRPHTIAPLQHKLYVSPRPDALPALFPRLVETLDAMGVPAFKIGASAAALLRPDKLVAYFASRDHLAAVAEDLAVSLGRVPPQGVPFTAPLDATGLLSWGYDPGADGGSWRLWIARALAGAVALAPAVAVEEAVAHVHGTLRSGGVDPDTWEPTGGIAL